MSAASTRERQIASWVGNELERVKRDYIDGYDTVQQLEVRVALALGFRQTVCPVCRVAAADGRCINGHAV